MIPLLALYTCHAYNYDMRGMVPYPVRPQMLRRPAIKATWLQDVDIPYRWFFGKHTEGNQPGEDEVFLDCPDDYYSLPHKTQAIAQWAIANGFDRVFKVDDDTFIHWDRFKTRPCFQDVEYSGGCWDGSSHAYGGCYVMAGKMLDAVAFTPIERGTWGEDSWVGSVAKKNGVAFTRDDTFHYGSVDVHTNVQAVDDSLLETAHGYSVLNPLTPEQMLRYYAAAKREASELGQSR